MEVVDTGSNIIQRIWAPVDAVDIYYVGSLVGWESGAFDGVVMAGAGNAGPDTATNICGIIEAVDERDPTFSAAVGGTQVTGVSTQAAQIARNLGYSSDRGVRIHGDAAAYVKVALLTPWTKVKIPIYDTTLGTGTTLLTATTADTGGLGATWTTNAMQVTPVANETTTFCRSGGNAGIMRTSDDASTTDPTHDQAFPFSVAIGDTFIRVPFRSFGQSFITTDTEGQFVDSGVTSATNTYWDFNILELNLEKVGGEYMVGFFSYIHFD